MNKNIKPLLIMMGALIIGLIIWNIYLLNINQKITKEKQEAEENYQHLEGYNEILKYDLTTARDSVRVFKDKMKVDE